MAEHIKADREALGVLASNTLHSVLYCTYILLFTCYVLKEVKLSHPINFIFLSDYLNYLRLI